MIEESQNEWLRVGIEVLSQISDEKESIEAAALLGVLKGIKSGAVTHGVPELLELAVAFCRENPDGRHLLLTDFAAAGLFNPQLLDCCKGKDGWENRL